MESVKDVVASVVGAAACCYTGQPFDTVKVRMQANPDSFRNALQCTYVTVAEEGIPALWKVSIHNLSSTCKPHMPVLQYTR